VSMQLPLEYSLSIEDGLDRVWFAASLEVFFRSQAPVHQFEVRKRADTGSVHREIR